MRRAFLLVVGVALPAAVLLALAACHRDRSKAFLGEDHDTGGAVQAESTAQAARFSSATESWVELYRPDKASSGYTLILYQRRCLMLLDMNGRVVHWWPNARVRGRARLFTDGRVLALCTDNTLREFDWDGGVLWEYSRDGPDIAHHDVIRLRNGNTLAVYMDAGVAEDYLLEIDKTGAEVWVWRSGDHLRDRIAAARPNPQDKTHINSVQELPPNPHFYGGDLRFAPGNILVSARHLNAVFVVDRSSGRVVWYFDRGLDFQHEAIMLATGMPGAGQILLFNNGYNNRYHYRRSLVQAIDPSHDAVVWEYSSPYFFSSTGGVEQMLPNGNVLITSSRGGRCFEVDRDGEIVWQWVPPYDPIRPTRYRYDHCPQLTALTPPAEDAVTPVTDEPYVDRELRRFARRAATHVQQVGSRSERVLEEPEGCRRLIVPGGAVLDVGYGIAPEVARECGNDDLAVAFRATVYREDEPKAVFCVSDTVVFGDDRVWRRRRSRLGVPAGRVVRVCLEATAVGCPDPRLAGRLALWSNLLISSPYERRALVMPGLEAPTEAEKRVGVEHLRALGYVD